MLPSGLFAGWREPFRQHDVAEFPQHTAQVVRTEILGQWRLRGAAHVEPGVRERGTTWPLTLQADLSARDRVSLQSVVEIWHEQYLQPCPAASPRIVVLQLSRFLSNGAKLDFALEDEDNVLLPVWKFHGSCMRDGGICFIQATRPSLATTSFMILRPACSLMTVFSGRRTSQQNLPSVPTVP